MMAMDDPSLPHGEIINDEIVVKGSQAISLYNKGYYGRPEQDQVILSGYEGLHLLELSRIVITYQGKSIGEAEVMAYFASDNPTFMPRYLVYKDLRNRGYIVNIGEGSSFFFRLYERGAVPKKDAASYYVTPLQEGNSIQLGSLEDLVQLAELSKKLLVFGLVDAVGDVSYLKISQLTPPLIKDKYKQFDSWMWESAWKDYLSWD